MNLLVMFKRVGVASLLVVSILLIFRPIVAVLLMAMLLVLYKSAARAYAYDKLLPFIAFVTKYAGWIIVIQCALYAFAFNALMPGGMYFSPDSVSYLSVSKLAPPNFSLLARALVEIEVGLGSTRIVLLRYVSIAIYSMGGWLIARALIRSGRPMLATLVLPAIWSVSSLTQWFNFFLTDGISTAFVVACIGAYANLHVSLRGQYKENADTWRWLSLFVFFGMVSFALRPAFGFILPGMAILMINRAIFSWRRLAAVVIATVLLATGHFSFAKYYHGQHPSQMGAVLTTLVFDLPVPNSCLVTDVSDLCNTQRALEPFIQSSRGAGSAQAQFLYKALNNLKVVEAAREALPGYNPNDPNYSALLEIALLKIKSNPLAYVSMVLKNSYYSIKIWGHRISNNDSFGSDMIMQNAAITSRIAPAVTGVMKSFANIDFDPTIKPLPAEKSYRTYVFQLPRLLLIHDLVTNLTFGITIVILFFGLRFLLVPMSLTSSILSSCCILFVGALVFQNAFFPVIPRLLDPLHPLGALGALMLGSMVVDKIKNIPSN
jgi:hypothetical protein